MDGDTITFGKDVTRETPKAGRTAIHNQALSVRVSLGQQTPASVAPASSPAPYAAHPRRSLYSLSHDEQMTSSDDEKDNRRVKFETKVAEAEHEEDEADEDSMGDVASPKTHSPPIVHDETIDSEEEVVETPAVDDSTQTAARPTEDEDEDESDNYDEDEEQGEAAESSEMELESNVDDEDEGIDGDSHSEGCSSAEGVDDESDMDAAEDEDGDGESSDEYDEHEDGSEDEEDEEHKEEEAGAHSGEEGEDAIQDADGEVVQAACAVEASSSVTMPPTEAMVHIEASTLDSEEHADAQAPVKNTQKEMDVDVASDNGGRDASAPSSPLFLPDLRLPDNRESPAATSDDGDHHEKEDSDKATHTTPQDKSTDTSGQEPSSSASPTHESRDTELLKQSLREVLAEHTLNASCTVCHSKPEQSVDRELDAQLQESVLTGEAFAAAAADIMKVVLTSKTSRDGNHQTTEQSVIDRSTQTIMVSDEQDSESESQGTAGAETAGHIAAIGAPYSNRKSLKRKRGPDGEEEQAELERRLDQGYSSDTSDDTLRDVSPPRRHRRRHDSANVGGFWTSAAKHSAIFLAGAASAIFGLAYMPDDWFEVAETGVSAGLGPLSSSMAAPPA